MDDTGDMSTSDGGSEEAGAMTSAATAFLDALDAAQRDAAQFDLTDSERSAGPISCG